MPDENRLDDHSSKARICEKARRETNRDGGGYTRGLESGTHPGMLGDPDRTGDSEPAWSWSWCSRLGAQR